METNILICIIIILVISLILICIIIKKQTSFRQCCLF